MLLLNTFTSHPVTWNNIFSSVFYCVAKLLGCPLVFFCNVRVINILSRIKKNIFLNKFQVHVFHRRKPSLKTQSVCNPFVKSMFSSLWRRANAQNVRLYSDPYWQYTNLFIFRFVFLHCLRSTLRLFKKRYISFTSNSLSKPLFLVSGFTVSKDFTCCWNFFIGILESPKLMYSSKASCTNEYCFYNGRKTEFQPKTFYVLVRWSDGYIGRLHMCTTYNLLMISEML